MKTAAQLTIITLVFLLFTGIANAYTITGNVEGVGVGPLSNASVTVINFTSSLPVNTTTTDASGDYAVDIPDDPRIYQIRASAPAFVNSTRIDFINGSLTRDFSLGPLNPIVNVTGHVTDQDNNDLSSANVRAVVSTSTLSSDVSDGSGDYMLPVVNDTTYDFYFTREGYTVCTVEDMHITGNTADVDCQLTQTNPWGTVEGYVKNAANLTETISGAQVTLSIGDGIIATAATDATGYYTIDVAQNDYNITATATGFEEGAGTVSALIGETTERNFSLNPVAAPASCTDADGDGYYAEAGCGTAVDCNDSDSAVHPGASEICGDNIDNDCDGRVDEGCGGGQQYYGGGGSGGGGGGGGSYDETGLDLSGCTQSVVVTFNDKLVYYYKSTRYEFLVQSVTASIVKMRLFPPPSRDFQWNNLGENKVFIDLDRSGDEDLMVELKSIERNQATMYLKDLHCTQSDYTSPEPTEKEAEEEEETEEVTVEKFKEGILNILSEFIPTKKASPLIGGAIALGIILLGLAGFAGYRKVKGRKQKPKKGGYSFEK